jgi:protein SCO1/2
MLAVLAVPALAQHEHHQHPMATPAPAPAVETIKVTIPDVAVVTQDGKKVRFYTDLVKGRVVAMNFLFTTCTTICPPMGANFAKLQTLLGEREVQLISVSVDPTTDTPARLKAWAEKFGGRPGWTLVTGSKSEITRLLKALGVYTANVNDHSPLVLLGDDAQGRWTRASGLAPPVKLVELFDGLNRTSGAAAGAAKESRP